jgi:hypothetical protein
VEEEGGGRRKKGERKISKDNFVINSTEKPVLPQRI